MKYFKNENSRKTVKYDLPEHITTLKDTRKEDWIDIYIELGFVLYDDYVSDSNKPTLDYLMDFKHQKDGSLQVRHWYSRGTHHIMPLRTTKKNPLDREYKENMIELQSCDGLTVSLEAVLLQIRSVYRSV